jgi:hypothetical protein
LAEGHFATGLLGRLLVAQRVHRFSRWTGAPPLLLTTEWGGG